MKKKNIAKCVGCGAERAALPTDEVSPYRKGDYIYDCGDKEKHARIRAEVEKMPGDPDAPKPRAPKLVKGEKETLRTLW